MAILSKMSLPPGSPRTSEEASQNGTPSTNITVATPEVASTRRPALKVVVRDSSEDVFGGATTKNVASVLSPTAEEFLPIGVAALIPSSTMATSSGKINQQNSANPFGAIRDTPANSSSKRSRLLADTSFPAAPAAKTPSGFPEGDLLSRSFCVRAPDDHTGRRIMSSIINGGFRSLLSVSAHKAHDGSFFVSFADIRDAAAAFAIATSAGRNVTVTYISAKDLAESEGRTDISRVTDFESDLLITILLPGAHEVPSVSTMRFIEDALIAFGELRILAPLPTYEGHVREFRAEYFDVRCAKEAASHMHATKFENVFISVQPFRPDAVTDADRPNAAVHRAIVNDVSVTGRSFCPPGGVDEQRRAIAMVLTEPFHKHRRRRNNVPAQNNGDRISLGDIAAGLDVRTTVMLRNIPNKMTAAQLKVIVDQTSKGLYDFMYLRIDFVNECNVGYAFINFVDASAIIPFADARVGLKWDFPQSEKLAELSYATIQGRDCLIEKFRNSSVLLEAPEYRPKLFKVGDGPDAGQEEKFPMPNNLSKMRRSVENAEHIGLFAPRQGQAHRSAQRNRISNFDRGVQEAFLGYQSRFPGSFSPRPPLGGHFPPVTARPAPARIPPRAYSPRDQYFPHSAQSGRFASRFWG